MKRMMAEMEDHGSSRAMHSPMNQHPNQHTAVSLPVAQHGLQACTAPLLLLLLLLLLLTFD
jgi:hypothetical protein